MWKYKCPHYRCSKTLRALFVFQINPTRCRNGVSHSTYCMDEASVPGKLPEKQQTPVKLSFSSSTSTFVLLFQAVAISAAHERPPFLINAVAAAQKSSLRVLFPTLKVMSKWNHKKADNFAWIALQFKQHTVVQSGFNTTGRSRLNNVVYSIRRRLVKNQGSILWVTGEDCARTTEWHHHHMTELRNQHLHNLIEQVI